MSKSIRYDGGRDVQLEAFGVRPSQVPGVGSRELSLGIDALAGRAQAEKDQTQAANFAEQGQMAAMKRNPDGSLAPLELYENDTHSGRAYNAAAINAYTTATLLDAGKFASDTVTKLDTETTPTGALKSVDKLADWDKSWTAYSEKTLGGLPDQVRAQVQERMAATGSQFRNGIAEKQYVETTQKTLQDMGTAVGRLAQDVGSLSFAGKDEAATAALTEIDRLRQSMKAIGGKLVDSQKIDEAFDSIVNTRMTAIVYREGFDILTKEVAKGRNFETEGLKKAYDWIDSQAIAQDQKQTAKGLVAAQASILQQQHGERDARAYQDFAPEMAGYIAKIMTTMRDHGEATALAYTQREANAATNPSIRAFWSNQGVNIASRLGSPTPEQIAADTAALQPYAHGKDPKQLLDDALSGRLGMDSARVNANLKQGLALAEGYRQRVVAAQASTISAFNNIATMKTTGITPDVDLAGYDKNANTIYSGYEMPDQPGVKTRSIDVRFGSNPQGFLQFVGSGKQGIGMVPSDAVKDVMAWVKQGGATPEATVQQAQVLAQIFDPSSGINTGKFTAEDLGIARATVQRVMSSVIRNAPMEGATPEEARRSQALMRKEVMSAFDDAGKTTADTPDLRKERINRNIKETAASIGGDVYDIDTKLRGQLGRELETLDNMTMAAAKEATGLNVGGALNLFAGKVPVVTTRLATMAGNQIDHYEVTQKFASPLSNAIEWLGDSARGWLGTENGGEALRGFFDRVFQPENLIVDARIYPTIKGMVTANMAYDNLAPKERFDRSVSDIRPNYGASQFRPGGKEGKATLVEQPIENAAGGRGPAFVLLTRYVEKQMDGETLFKGGNIDPRVAVMRGDVHAYFTGLKVDPETGTKYKEYRVQAVQADGRTYAFTEPMRIRDDFGQIVDKARIEAQQAEAVRLRTLRQQGVDPFPVVSNPDAVGARPDPARSLAVGDLRGSLIRNEGVAIYNAGRLAALAKIEEYSAGTDMTPIKFPKPADRKPAP